MIDERSYILWGNIAPWPISGQIRQDLVISRALVEMYQHPILKKELAFRGGTALQKLFYKEATRYSEDIDLVQVEGKGIGEILDAFREIFEPWLGKPKRKIGEGRATLIYRFKAGPEEYDKVRLKVEINTREHFSKLPLQSVPFEVNTPWFSGRSNILTYSLNELLGTKMRALYQRKKGRDLFDMVKAIELLDINTDEILACFKSYMDFMDLTVSRAEFEKNLYQKKEMPLFRRDIEPLLASNANFNFDEGFKLVMDTIINKLPGESWKGEVG